MTIDELAGYPRGYALRRTTWRESIQGRRRGPCRQASFVEKSLMSSRTTSIWRSWPCQSKMFLRRRPGTHWTAIQGASCDLTVAACAGVLVDRSGRAAVIGLGTEVLKPRSIQHPACRLQSRDGRRRSVQCESICARPHGDTARQSHAASTALLARSVLCAPVAVHQRRKKRTMG